MAEERTGCRQWPWSIDAGYPADIWDKLRRYGLDDGEPLYPGYLCKDVRSSRGCHRSPAGVALRVVVILHVTA